MRVVVKLGTKLLTKSNGILNEENISRIVRELGEIIDLGAELILVSSGAIGAGCGRMNCNPSELNLMEKQALAGVGQTDLMNIYKNEFAKQNRIVGQVLITAQDIADKQRYLNIRNTFSAMRKWNIIPIINENDSVTAEEIRYGDNDHISALITAKVDAEKLVILTDVDGLKDGAGNIVKEIKEVNEDILALAGGRGSEYSVGGMSSKLRAAESVSKQCGINTYLANGNTPGVLKRIFEDENPGTVFVGKSCGISQKKKWIFYGLIPAGTLFIDDGAVSALLNKKSSLLPIGIKKIKGKFNLGDAVDCMDMSGKIVARGLVNYSSKDIKKIMGHKSNDIEAVLGIKFYDPEVINRDNLVIV